MKMRRFFNNFDFTRKIRENATGFLTALISREKYVKMQRCFFTTLISREK